MGVSTGAIGEEVLALLTVQFVKCSGEIQVLTVRFRFPHDRVTVVLVATDEHVFAWVDADDLFFIHAKTDTASRLKEENQKRNKSDC